MIKDMCDICGKRKATHKYKVKESLLGRYVRTRHIFSYKSVWNRYKRIKVCETCGSKFLGTLNRDKIDRRTI